MKKSSKSKRDESPKPVTRTWMRGGWVAYTPWERLSCLGLAVSCCALAVLAFVERGSSTYANAAAALQTGIVANGIGIIGYVFSNRRVKKA